MTAPVDATDAVSVLSEMVAEARPDRTLATAFVGALRALWLEDMRSQQQPAAVLTSEVANGRESPEVEAAVAGDLSAEAGEGQYRPADDAAAGRQLPAVQLGVSDGGHHQQCPLRPPRRKRTQHLARFGGVGGSGDEG